MRAGCITVASGYANAGLTVPEIALDIYYRSASAHEHMRKAVLAGIVSPPLLHPPAIAS